MKKKYSLSPLRKKWVSDGHLRDLLETFFEGHPYFQNSLSLPELLTHRFIHDWNLTEVNRYPNMLFVLLNEHNNRKTNIERLTPQYRRVHHISTFIYSENLSASSPPWQLTGITKSSRCILHHLNASFDVEHCNWPSTLEQNRTPHKNAIARIR